MLLVGGWFDKASHRGSSLSDNILNELDVDLRRTGQVLVTNEATKPLLHLYQTYTVGLGLEYWKE